MKDEPAVKAGIVGMIGSATTLLLALGVHVPSLDDSQKMLAAVLIVGVINIGQAFWTRNRVTPVAK